MTGYLPHTPSDVATMLAAIGIDSVGELFRQVPAHLRAQARIDLAPGCTEMELRDRLNAFANDNVAADRCPVFLGGGSYPHLIPTAVDQMLLRSEFATAYTPYQPEVSQGTLQAIFEFQTFVALLMGMEVANASMYDAASATAEAVLMARRMVPGRRMAWLARSLHPHYRQTVTTYLRGLGDVEVGELPFGADGRIDPAGLRERLGPDTFCVVVGYPNVFGSLEDLPAIAEAAHAVGAVAISATAESMALGLVRPPGASSIDIAVGEGQSLGLPMSYGGPGVGLFATSDKHVRAMPGRLCGSTVDVDGRPGFVLTLNTREQHIRRERATSNICTNQGLCSLGVTAYLSLVGRHGLRAVAQANYQNAHRAAQQLQAAGVKARFSAPFFNEFVVNVPDAANVIAKAARAGEVVAGFPLATWYPELDDAVLLCATEAHGAADIDRLVATLARGR